MLKRRAQIQAKPRDWQPTLTQVAERANQIWHQDGCPSTSELDYWVRASAQLKTEHSQLVASEDYTTRAAAGMENVSLSDRRRNATRPALPQ